MAQGLGICLFAFGGAHWPLATAHSDPLWVRTCFGCVVCVCVCVCVVGAGGGGGGSSLKTALNLTAITIFRSSASLIIAHSHNSLVGVGWPCTRQSPYATDPLKCLGVCDLLHG